MTTTVLAYFPSPPQGVWHLGPVPLRAYALFIIIGIIAALLIGDRRWEARGGERGVIYDIALWAVPFGLIGGRLYHLATDWRTYFGEGGAGPIAALRIWDGGLGIWGAVALGGVGAWIACRRRDIPLPAFGDAIAPGIVLAQAIGRLGNYFNQELFGRETTMPWGLEIFYRRDPAGFVDVHSLDGVSTGQLAMVVQPTFLYELLWNLTDFRRPDLPGPPIQARARPACSRRTSPATASAGSGSSCSATTPPPISPASGSTPSPRRSSSSVRWCI